MGSMSLSCQCRRMLSIEVKILFWTKLPVVRSNDPVKCPDHYLKVYSSLLMHLFYRNQLPWVTSIILILIFFPIACGSTSTPTPTSPSPSISIPASKSLLASINALDSYTLRFTLTHPDAAFLSKLAFPALGIQSPANIKKHGGGEDLIRNPVGTGPFRFVEWLPDDRITLQRNDDYWGAKPTLDTLTFRPIKEAPARFLELQAGTVRRRRQPVARRHPRRPGQPQPERLPPLAVPGRLPGHQPRPRAVRRRPSTPGSGLGHRQGRAGQGILPTHGPGGGPVRAAGHLWPHRRAGRLALRSGAGQDPAGRRRLPRRLQDHAVDHGHLAALLSQSRSGWRGAPGRPGQGGHPGRDRQLRLGHLFGKDACRRGRPVPQRLDGRLSGRHQLSRHLFHRRRRQFGDTVS